MARLMYWSVLLGLAGITLLAFTGAAASLLLWSYVLEGEGASAIPDLLRDTIGAVSRFLLAAGALYFIPRIIRKQAMEPR